MNVHGRTARPALALLAAGLLLGVGCGASRPASPTGTRVGDGSTVGTSAIDGLYFNGHSVLRVDTGEWTLQAQTLHLQGHIEVSQDRLVLSGESSCPGRGEYSWSLAGRTLELEAQQDPCPGRDVTMSGSWRPIQALAGGSRPGANVVLPDLHFATYQGRADVSTESSTHIEVMIRKGVGWVFSPTVLIGEPGQKLELTIGNPTGNRIVTLPHNFSLPEQGIDADIAPGTQATVTVAFPESGSLTFFCRFHADHGQTGVLTATP